MRNKKIDFGNWIEPAKARIFLQKNLGLTAKNAINALTNNFNCIENKFKQIGYDKDELTSFFNKKININSQTPFKYENKFMFNTPIFNSGRKETFYKRIIEYISDNGGAKIEELSYHIYGDSTKNINHFIVAFIELGVLQHDFNGYITPNSRFAEFCDYMENRIKLINKK